MVDYFKFSCPSILRFYVPTLEHKTFILCNKPFVRLYHTEGLLVTRKSSGNGRFYRRLHSIQSSAYAISFFFVIPSRLRFQLLAEPGFLLFRHRVHLSSMAQKRTSLKICLSLTTFATASSKQFSQKVFRLFDYCFRTFLNQEISVSESP